MKESDYMNSNTFKTFLTSTISISDLTRTGAKQIFDNISKSGSKIVLKNNKPIATLVSIDRYQELLEKEEDLNLIQIAISRKAHSSEIISREDFFKENNINEEVLSELPEIDME